MCEYCKYFGSATYFNLFIHPVQTALQDCTESSQEWLEQIFLGGFFCFCVSQVFCVSSSSFLERPLDRRLPTQAAQNDCASIFFNSGRFRCSFLWQRFMVKRPELSSMSLIATSNKKLLGGGHSYQGGGHYKQQETTSSSWPYYAFGRYVRGWHRDSKRSILSNRKLSTSMGPHSSTRHFYATRPCFCSRKTHVARTMQATGM